MKSIIIVLINGEKYLFENKNFTADQKEDLENLAQDIYNIEPELKRKEEKKIISWFINEAKEKFNIILENINVSFIIRIKK